MIMMVRMMVKRLTRKRSRFDDDEHDDGENGDDGNHHEYVKGMEVILVITINKQTFPDAKLGRW